MDGCGNYEVTSLMSLGGGGKHCHRCASATLKLTLSWMHRHCPLTVGCLLDQDLGEERRENGRERERELR
jgi:hypothetical protein